MKKLSEAEKNRRKEKAIYDHSEHLLNIIWACRDSAEYNRVQWHKKDLYLYVKMWSSFQDGCRLADGVKWYNRLNKQWKDYEKEHGKLIE